MNYELDKSNNSKKLIIEVSILFCIIILIIGGTFAFFTQSSNNELGNIVTTDINGTLLYRDDYEENNLYNRQGLLIPASLDVVLKTYKRVDTENKCLDSTNIYAACSVYRFSIKNNSNVTQELIMNLNPTANSYNNLKFLLFKIKNNNPEQINNKPISLEKGNYSSIQLVENFTLTPNEERMYELVFYVENQPYAQDDAGKTFGAGISINSVTTGAYVNKQYGDTCWNVDQTDPTKLISFNGILDDGSIDESCTGYVDIVETKDNVNYYSVTIPSSFGGNDIKTIGNDLLNAVEEYDLSAMKISKVNKYHNIKEITISEGITTIEEGDLYTLTGSFAGIGIQVGAGFGDSNRSLKVILPKTMKDIGALAFVGTALDSLTIYDSVDTIGTYSFAMTTNFKDLSFSEIQNKTNTMTINDYAFQGSGLKTIELPNNLTHIGNYAFHDNIDVKEVKEITIPASVEYIGDAAFAIDTLTKVTFEINQSQLKTIGNQAFIGCNLTYSKDDPLILPSGITTIGASAFVDNPYLEGIRFEGTLTAGNTDWYNSSVTTLNP